MSPLSMRRLLQFDLVHSRDVAIHLAVDHHFLGMHIGAHPAIGSDHQVVVVQVDIALDLAVKIEIFTSRQFAFYDDRLADVSNIGAIDVSILGVSTVGSGMAKGPERQVPAAAG